ncbi:prolipoprotein diacylglyceryl transferase [Brevibacterium sp. BRM-1]|nr:prolipoprotein diacylglyceryl transferase [Brevibacterium sp. BRM-1]
MHAAGIPSPTWSGFSLGPLTIHAYALCILAGILLALWVTNRRWTARGGTSDDLWSIAVWAIPAGIIGGRLYHVLSTPEPYFGRGGNPVAALYIWNGGLGIWGAVALGVLAAWWAARRHGVRFGAFLDAAAPGLILAQACGRWGNWFNQELFGAPTTLPWGLHIDKVLAGRPNPNWPDPALPAGTLFQPTFLYESLWNLGVFFVLIWAGRRLRMGHGQVFFSYICLYTLGRVWIEALRIDDAEHILGLRLNVWTSILVFALGAVLFAVSRMRHERPEPHVHTRERLAYDAAAERLLEATGEQAPPYVRGAAPPAVPAPAAPPGPRRPRSPADAPARPTAPGHGGAPAAGAAPAREVGFGPETSQLPIVADPADEDPGSEFSQRSFGFFGAVTSAISIVPQVDRPEGETGHGPPAR